MNCEKPFVKDGGAFGCGQCTPCRINKRREWTHRIMLESALRSDNSFVTLTYDDEHYPDDHSVTPREWQLFMKRLRKRLDWKIRYYACGEYGHETGRPHYHAILFGYPQCNYGNTQYDSDGVVKCCRQCKIIEDAWQKGRIQNAELNFKTAQYVAGYVVKKWTKHDDPRLEGRLPEFARMSLRPGIGYDMMYEVADVLMKHGLEDKFIDVPTTLAHGKQKLPLGRYLRMKLRRMVGHDEKAPAEALEIYKEKLRPLRESAFDNSRSFAEEIKKASLGRRIQIHAREKRQRKTPL